MKANTFYNDIEGSVSIDISNKIIPVGGNKLKTYSEHYKINNEIYEVIGIELDGPSPFSLSLICIEKNKSTDNKKHIISIHVDSDSNNNENTLFNSLFENINILLIDSKYKNSLIEIDEYLSTENL